MIKIERKPIDEFVDIYNMAVAKKDNIEQRIEEERQRELDELYLKVSEINAKYDEKKAKDTAVLDNLIFQTTEEVEVDYPDEIVEQPTETETIG